MALDALAVGIHWMEMLLAERERMHSEERLSVQVPT
jgi:hypothetical protein